MQKENMSSCRYRPVYRTTVEADGQGMADSDAWVEPKSHDGTKSAKGA